VSQQEFENYLALLTRLLRVAPPQREQLAEEFRAHLEDRLDELLAGGMSREKAVHTAIGEFGDAAVLAAELAQIAQRRRRRLLMKMSYAGVAGLALVGLLVFALWPDGRQAQGPPAAVAQGAGQEKTETPAPLPKAAPDRASQAHAKIQAALETETEFDFKDTPLKDFIDFIGANYKIPVVLCRGTLEDAAISPDTPVTSSLRGISLRSALRITLGELKLSFVIWDEVLQITTTEDAASRLVTRVYDCRELLALPSPPGSSRPIRGKGIAGGGGFFAVQDEPATKAPTPAGGTPSAPSGNAEAGGAPPVSGGEGGVKAAKAGEEAPKERELSDAENLIRLITTTVGPDSWDEVGGPGTVAEYKGLVVVSQTWEIHEKIERLLNMLHAAADLKEQRVKVVE
jgi:HAAS domain-containing protein